MSIDTSASSNRVAAIDDPSFEVDLTPLGRYMLEFRYLQRDEQGAITETPEQLFRRVAWNLAEAERLFDPAIGDDEIEGWAARFFDLMVGHRYLPNAPTLLGAGSPSQQLHACFVLPVADSIDGVFDTLRMAAVVHARGGGTGFSFSALRPRGAPIASGGRSTGPVPLMRVFDTETEVLKGGGTGWGANMGVLRVDHPDVAEFIGAKADGALRNFNISVGITDEFMAAVRTSSSFTLRDPATGAPAGAVDARDLFDQLCEQAWRTGDPGLLFLDRVADGNPAPALGRIEATNPCGEAPLLPFEACCLGGINVAHVLLGELVHGSVPLGIDPCTSSELAVEALDWEGLDATAALALRMMDNVIEASRYPLDEIREATHRTRKVGIGVMGFADLLIDLGIPYDSDEAVALAAQVMERIADATLLASAELAGARGSFPAFDQSIHADCGFIAMRNATTTSNAPNSTIGPIAGCSAGIEPLFALAYERVLASGERNRELDERFVRVAHERGFASDELFDDVRATGTVQHRPDVPDDVKRLFVTSHDIDPVWHVRIQAAFQQHTDLGVSKTVNLAHDATVADVAELYLLAHELGCKGTTVFREGCHHDQFLVRGAGTTSDPTCADGTCEVCS